VARKTRKGKRMNTLDITIGDKHLSLLKGGPGCGKSIAAHSYHVLGPTFTFDFDEKMNAVAAAYPKINFEYENFDDVFQALQLLTKLKQNCPYKVVIWDGWSPFCQLALQSVMGVRAPGKKRIVTANKTGDPIERYQIEDYGAESRACEQASMDLKHLYKQGVTIVTVVHVYKIVTHNILTNRDETQEGILIPGGKIAFNIPIVYNELYEFTVESDMTNGKSHQFFCTTTGNSCKTCLKVPQKFNWTDKNFHNELMSYHERESRVINL
jgi:hypothetical protein